MQVMPAQHQGNGEPTECKPDPDGLTARSKSSLGRQQTDVDAVSLVYQIEEVAEPAAMMKRRLISMAHLLVTVEVARTL